MDDPAMATVSMHEFIYPKTVPTDLHFTRDFSSYQPVDDGRRTDAMQYVTT